MNIYQPDISFSKLLLTSRSLYLHTNSITIHTFILINYIIYGQRSITSDCADYWRCS